MKPLGWSYEQRSKYEPAIAEFQKSVKLSDDGVAANASLAHLYAVAGKKREAEDILAKLIERSKKAYVSPYKLAIVCAGLGETDQAFHWLQQAYAERSGMLMGSRASTSFIPTRASWTCCAV